MNVLRIHILASHLLIFADFYRNEGSYVTGEEFQAQVKTRCEIINFSALSISVSNMIASELSLFCHNTIHDVLQSMNQEQNRLNCFNLDLSRSCIFAFGSSVK